MTPSLDNLAATVLVAAAVLVAGHVLQQGTRASVDVHRYHDLRKRTDLVVETVRRDLVNVGADVGEGGQRVWAPRDSAGLTVEFRFAGNVEGDAAVEHVRYRLARAPKACAVYVPAMRETVPVACYRFVRELCASAAFATCTSAGEGAAPLWQFRVALADGGGAEGGAPADARQVRVELGATSPDEPSRIVPVTLWSSRFRPVNLQ